MATLEKRVQVSFDPDRYKQLEAAAHDAGVSVGAFIREAVDERLAEQSNDRLTILKKLFAQADSIPQEPLPDWEELKADYENEMDPVHRLARNNAETPRMKHHVMEEAVLLDSSIPIYALSDSGRRKRPAQEYLEELTAGRGRGYASTEMIQEVVHHRLRTTKDPEAAAREGRMLMATLVILPFDQEVLETSLKLVARSPGMQGRNALHAATALVYGIPTVATSDHGFDLVPGITRVDPTAAR